RGQIRIIGASTFEDYRQHIEPKDAFARRFRPVNMSEPTHAECFKMLRHSYSQQYEDSDIKLSDHAIAAAIFFTKDIPRRYFPDKAIDIIEDAISETQMENISEEEITIDVRKIAEVYSASSREHRSVDLLIELFSTHIQHNRDYFPGLVASVPGLVASVTP
ncbi:MAG TPA: hypothetical protein VIJ14_09035, partial [Rhabdochlamydiaceae bacterium]